MSKIDTDIFVGKDDVGKNLYRKKTYYTLVIEQDVLANDKDEADTLLTDGGGINHDKVTKDLTDTNKGVETYMVDANYTDSETTQYMGKVKYDTDTYDQSLEDAMENGDIHIDTWADETEPHQLTKIKLKVDDNNNLSDKDGKVYFTGEKMTPEEEDRNAGITRDKDGNVISEVTNG